METLKTAESPQEEKYPSDSTVREGFMYEDSQPKVGHNFYVQGEKPGKMFQTSDVAAIQKVNTNQMIILTRNSRYQLDILGPVSN